MDADQDALSLAWLHAQARLPDGWQLESLRCAWAGLTPERRSDDWVAIATGPDATERTCRAADPFDAVEALVTLVDEEQRPGSVTAPALSKEEVDRIMAEAFERGRAQPTSGTTLYVPSPKPRS